VLDDVSGMFKALENPSFIFFNKTCVLAFNKKVLDKRVHTPWRNVLKLCDDD